MSVPPVLRALVDGLYHVQTTRFAQLASSSIIVYDHIITFDDEVDLIWSSPWSWTKVLFLLNRYYSLAAVAMNNYGFFSNFLTDTVSFRFFHWQGWTGLIGCILAEAILVMRLYALYNRNKKVLCLMLFAYFGSLATAGWIMGTVLVDIHATAVQIPGGVFCVPHGVSDQFYIFWIPMLGFECMLCALALLRGFQTLKTGGGIFSSGRQLAALLVRDSILYFFVICATYATCLLVWLALPTTLLEVPIGFSIAMSCVLSNRILLNVREVGRDRELSKTSSEKPVNENQIGWETSFCSPGCVTEFEMDQVRSIRGERFSDIMDYYEYEADPVPWKVL